MGDGLWDYNFALLNNNRNRMRKMMLFLGGVACVAAAWAQDYQKTAYGVKATVNAVDVEVQFFTPSVVRILKSPHGESFEKKVCRLWLLRVKSASKFLSRRGILCLAPRNYR